MPSPKIINRFAEALLTPRHVSYLLKMIAIDLSEAMKAGNVEDTAELIELKKYADTLAKANAQKA